MVTVKEMKEWLELMPDNTELCIDENGLCLEAPDYTDEEGDRCEMYLEVGTQVDNDLYTVRHSHRHGESTYVIKSDHLPTQEEVIEKLDIDFEPDREEFIEIDGPMKIDTIKED